MAVPIERERFSRMGREEVPRYADRYLTKTQMIAFLDQEARRKGYGDLYSTRQLRRESRDFIVELFADEILDPLAPRK